MWRFFVLRKILYLDLDVKDVFAGYDYHFYLIKIPISFPTFAI